MTAEPAQPRRRRSRHADFRRLWTGDALSRFGAEPRASIPVFTVQTLHAASGRWRAGAAEFAAFLAIGCRGSVGHRMRKRHVLIVTDLVRAGVLAAVVVAALPGPPRSRCSWPPRSCSACADCSSTSRTSPTSPGSWASARRRGQLETRRPRDRPGRSRARRRRTARHHRTVLLAVTVVTYVLARRGCGASTRAKPARERRGLWVEVREARVRPA